MVLYDPSATNSDTQQAMIRKVLELSEENNKMLKKMERRNKWARIFRIIYWSFIIITAIGAYYLLQPYIEVLKESLKAVSQNIGKFQELFKNFPVK